MISNMKKHVYCASLLLLLPSLAFTKLCKVHGDALIGYSQCSLSTNTRTGKKNFP